MLKALKERRWTWRAEALSALSRITYRYGCNYLTSVALDPWISALSSGFPPLSLLRAVIQELRSLNSPMAVSRVELASEAAMAQLMYSRGDGRAATAQDEANTPHNTSVRSDISHRSWEDGGGLVSWLLIFAFWGQCGALKFAPLNYTLHNTVICIIFFSSYFIVNPYKTDGAKYIFCLTKYTFRYL